MPASSRTVSSVQADIYSIYPSYYYPLYGNTPSSLFEPILIHKMYVHSDNAENEGRWSSEQVKNYVSAFCNATGALLDAEEMFDFESELDNEETDIDKDGGSAGKTAYNSAGKKKVLESLLSSGSYSVYNSLVGSFSHEHQTAPKDNNIGSGTNGLLLRVYGNSDQSSMTEPGWFTKLAEPEPEPTFDKIL